MNYSNTYYGEHATFINGKVINITEEDLIIVGKKANLKLEYMKDAISLVKDIVNKTIKD